MNKELLENSNITEKQVLKIIKGYMLKKIPNEFYYDEPQKKRLKDNI